MDRDTFIRRVGELEALAERSPGMYKAGLFAWIGVGLFAISSLAALVAGGVALTIVSIASGQFLILLKVGFKLLIPLALVGVALLRAAFFRIPQPEGVELNAQQNPKLFEELANLQAATGAPAPHRVILVDELNAAVAETPRLGLIPLFSKRTLILGLPLLHALSPAELRGVLAHELAHLSGGHNQLGNMIYRLRRTWIQLLGHLTAQGQAGWIRGFFNWYMPRFLPWTWVISRKQEYEADRVGAQATSPEIMASALSRVQLASWTADRYWSTLPKQSFDLPAPPHQAFTSYYSRIRTANQEKGREAALTRALVAPTNPDDTHPSLALRLQALQTPTPSLGDVEQTAAEHYFSAEQLANYAKERDEHLVERLTPKWPEIQKERAQQRAQLANLEQQMAAGKLTPEVVLQRAELVEVLQGPAEALAAWTAAWGISKTRRARFQMACLLLSEREDPSALVHLEACVAEEPAALPYAVEVVVPFLWGRGEADAAEVWLARVRAHQNALEAKELGQQKALSSGKARSVQLTDEERQELVAQLRGTPGIARVWALQREWEGKSGDGAPSESAVRILLIEPRPELSKEDQAQLIAVLGEHMRTTHRWVLLLANENKALQKSAEKLEDAELPV